MTRANFTPALIAKAFLRAQGKCEQCGILLKPGQYHADHIKPDGLGGKPTLENCQILCHPCHKLKTGKEDIPVMRKADRQAKRYAGIQKQGPRIPQRGFVKTIKVREPGPKEAQLRAMRERTQ